MSKTLVITTVEGVQQARVLAGSKPNPNNPTAKVGDVIPYTYNARVNGANWFCLGFESIEDLKESLLSGKYTMLQARAGNAQFGSNGGFTVKKQVTAATAEDMKLMYQQLQKDSQEQAENVGATTENVANELGLDDELFKSPRQRRLEAARAELLASMSTTAAGAPGLVVTK